ncbi:hypothetical protein PV-S19_0124 [Pacmanvirus S19]|nr:hypothetical protein PV-S19_0124 [Pacmanvirus S19]
MSKFRGYDILINEINKRLRDEMIITSEDLREIIEQLQLDTDGKIQMRQTWSMFRAPKIPPM